MRKYSAIEKFRILDSNITVGVPLSRIAADRQVPLRTLQDWKRRFLSDGFKGFQVKERKDKGVHRSLSDELTETVKAFCLLKPALTVKAILREVRVHLKALDLRCPS